MTSCVIRRLEVYDFNPLPPQTSGIGVLVLYLLNRSRSLATVPHEILGYRLHLQHGIAV
jgi:hypothetical protein